MPLYNINMGASSTRPVLKKKIILTLTNVEVLKRMNVSSKTLEGVKLKICIIKMH